MVTTVLFLILAVSLAAVGNLLLKRGMRSIDGSKGPVSLRSTAFHALRTPSVWLGTASYATAMMAWLQVLARAEIGLVYPIFSGATTVTVMIASVFALKERLGRWRALGAALMIAGVFVASLE